MPINRHPRDKDEGYPPIHKMVLAFFRQFVLRFDYLQILSVVCLLTIGLIFIYSTGQQVGGAMSVAWKRQIVWILFGIVLWLLFSLADYRLLAWIAPVLFTVTIILLVLVLTQGTVTKGARRWLPIMGVRVQPTEFAKISTIILASWLASRESFNPNRITHFLALAAVVLFPYLLILKQPDLGSSLIFPAVLGTLLFVSNLKWKWIVLLLLAVVLLVPAVYFSPFLKDYQKERVRVFLDPDYDPSGKGWTSRQTLLAVGSGGMFGKGIMKGTQNALGFLSPTESNNDLIFSVVAEETGFVGSTFLLCLYLLLLASTLRTSLVAADRFGHMLAASTAALFFTQSFIHIVVNVRLLPFTGIPLPLVSYGGSFVVSAAVCLGILQSIYMRR